jgi:pilus assembly protein CpaE
MQAAPQAPQMPAPMNGQPPMMAPPPGAYPTPGAAPQAAATMPPMQSPAVSAQSPIAPPVVENNKEGGEKALPRIAIHAFCERSETAGAIQATTQDWRMARVNLKIYMGGLPAAIEFYHKENTPGLILFESGMRGPELFAQLDTLASVCDTGTKVVMIGAANDIRLYRELTEKGLSDYLVPPFHPLTLIRSLSDLYADPDKPFVGRVAAFFGAKGGVGSSTIAHNIAWGLASKLNQETSLVDMDSSWGTTGLDFNYDSSQGLEEALAEPDRLDETLLDRIMIRHTEKLTILPAGANLGSSAPNSPEAFEALINGVRSLSPLTILDMPHIWSDWSTQTLTRADDVVITATPDLANLRNTKNLIDYLKEARPNDAEPLLILNKTGVPKTAEIPVKDFAAAVGIQPSVVLAYEPIVYTEASNDGKMLSDLKSASAAFEGLMYLAQRLQTGQFPEPVSTKKGRKVKPAKKGKKAVAVDTQAPQEKNSKSLFAKLKKRK